MSQEQKRVSSVLDQMEAERLGAPKIIASLERVVDFVTGNRTGGGEALARLLMNCYDYSEYSFDITELCRLDDDLYEDALNVIRLRTRLDREPHSFFVDGGRLMNQIAADYRIERKSSQASEISEAHV